METKQFKKEIIYMIINRKMLFNLYMREIDKIAEDCDWKTNFTPEEIISIVCKIINENSSSLFEEKRLSIDKSL